MLTTSRVGGAAKQGNVDVLPKNLIKVAGSLELTIGGVLKVRTQLSRQKR